MLLSVLPFGPQYAEPSQASYSQFVILLAAEKRPSGINNISQRPQVIRPLGCIFLVLHRQD